MWETLQLGVGKLHQNCVWNQVLCVQGNPTFGCVYGHPTSGWVRNPAFVCVCMQRSHIYIYIYGCVGKTYIGGGWENLHLGQWGNPTYGLCRRTVHMGVWGGNLTPGCEGNLHVGVGEAYTGWVGKSYIWVCVHMGVWGESYSWECVGTLHVSVGEPYIWVCVGTLYLGECAEPCIWLCETPYCGAAWETHFWAHCYGSDKNLFNWNKRSSTGMMINLPITSPYRDKSQDYCVAYTMEMTYSCVMTSHFRIVPDAFTALSMLNNTMKTCGIKVGGRGGENVDNL